MIPRHNLPKLIATFNYSAYNCLALKTSSDTIESARYTRTHTRSTAETSVKTITKDASQPITANLLRDCIGEEEGARKEGTSLYALATASAVQRRR